MQRKTLILVCAGVFLLALGSSSFGADPPSDTAISPPRAEATNPPMTTTAAPQSTSQKAMAGTAVASTPATVTNPNQIYLIRENPFFNLHIEKAVQHAREAEIAGNMGESEVLLEHARISLMQAHEAQRAGNVPGLNEGIANLKKALNLPIWMTQSSTQVASVEGADPRCTEELQRECGDVQPGSGRLQQCFDDKINNFSPMCQEKLKEGKAATAAAVTTTRHEQSLTGTQRTDAAVRSATDHVREARKNLSEAGGLKYKEIQPQTVKTVAQ